MEEDNGWMPLGSIRKDERPRKSYVPADEMDCFFTDVPVRGWRRITMSAAGEVQHDRKKTGGPH